MPLTVSRKRVQTGPNNVTLCARWKPSLRTLATPGNAFAALRQNITFVVRRSSDCAAAVASVLSMTLISRLVSHTDSQIQCGVSKHTAAAAATTTVVVALLLLVVVEV